MTQFVSLAGARLAALSGHVITLKPGVPTEVPSHMEVLARQNGCVPADSVDKNVLAALAGAAPAAPVNVPSPEAEDKVEPEVSPEVDVHQLVIGAIDVVMARGDEADLTKDKSRPRLAAVRAELPPGVEITSEQLDAALGNL